MAWERKLKDNNMQVFSLDNGRHHEFLAPVYVGNDNRYELYDILSVAGGFGIIYRAKDRRLGNHEVLVKSRRYDAEPGLREISQESIR